MKPGIDSNDLIVNDLDAIALDLCSPHLEQVGGGIPSRDRKRASQWPARCAAPAALRGGHASQGPAQPSRKDP
jgi:hypothetical protein